MGERGSEDVALDVRCDLGAPSEVRGAVGRLDGMGWMLGDAMLIASELVTNALRHSGCDERDLLHVELSQTPERLLISVRDPGASGKTAQARRPVDIGDGGIGLWLVEQLSGRWGAERNGGYRVWAELPLTG